MMSHQRALMSLPQPAAHTALSGFDYPPVGAVTVAYPNTAIREDRKNLEGKVPGFGQLHPRSQVGDVDAISHLFCFPTYEYDASPGVNHSLTPSVVICAHHTMDDFGGHTVVFIDSVGDMLAATTAT